MHVSIIYYSGTELLKFVETILKKKHPRISPDYVYLPYYHWNFGRRLWDAQHTLRLILDVGDLHVLYENLSVS